MTFFAKFAVFLVPWVQNKVLLLAVLLLTFLGDAKCRFFFIENKEPCYYSSPVERASTFSKMDVEWE